MCAGCQEVFYCSRTCQQKDWRRHKPECKLKVPTPPKTLEDGSVGTTALPSPSPVAPPPTSSEPAMAGTTYSEIFPFGRMFFISLGKEPSKQAMEAATDLFHLQSNRGLRGADNPCPSYIDKNGKTMML